MRIKVGEKKYWVYWNYNFKYPKKIQQKIEKLSKVEGFEDIKKDIGLQFHIFDIPEVITTCFILDDSIRVKDADGNLTGLDNLLAKGVTTKWHSDRHCKAIARAESLNKATNLLFGYDHEGITIFNNEAEKSGVKFESKKPKAKKGGFQISWEEWQQL